MLYFLNGIIDEKKNVLFEFEPKLFAITTISLLIRTILSYVVNGLRKKKL